MLLDIITCLLLGRGTYSPWQRTNQLGALHRASRARFPVVAIVADDQADLQCLLGPSDT